MDDKKKSLAIYRLQRAKEDLSASHLLFDNNKYRDSNNRSYYSIFHAIKAILALEGKDFKKHKDVIAHFNFAYVKTEIFPRELGKRIHISSDIREDSDYEDFYIATKQESKEQIQTAEELIQLVEKYIANYN